MTVTSIDSIDEFDEQLRVLVQLLRGVDEFLQLAFEVPWGRS